MNETNRREIVVELVSLWLDSRRGTALSEKACLHTGSAQATISKSKEMPSNEKFVTSSRELQNFNELLTFMYFT
jgi:hypothetical protein